MRVFDSQDDVREYFTERAAAADDVIQRIYAEGRPTGWNDKIKQAGELSFQYGNRAAYRDALAALDEVRPGFTAALEELQAKQAPFTAVGIWKDDES